MGNGLEYGFVPFGINLARGDAGAMSNSVKSSFGLVKCFNDASEVTVYVYLVCVFVIDVKEVWCNFFEVHQEVADLTFDFMRVFFAFIQ